MTGDQLPRPINGQYEQENEIFVMKTNKIISQYKGIAFGLMSLVPAFTCNTVSAQKIVGGVYNSYAICPDSTLWAWGKNDVGQVGDGTNNQQLVPVRTQVLDKVVSVKGGQDHTLALKADGTVWAWGNNAVGSLGNGTTSHVNTLAPAQVPGLSGVVSIAAGFGSSFAIKNDGTVWAWGYNAGQHGDGTDSNINRIPHQVLQYNGAKAVETGKGYSFALMPDGTVWASGFNVDGNLGNGTDIFSNVPVQVMGLSDIVAISGKKYHGMALKSDGTVWTWGWNHLGQLGNGTTTSSNIAIQVPGLSGIIAIAAGNSHSLVLKNDGTIWGWGRNDGNQLADGTTIDRSTPVRVSNLTNVIQIAAGDYHSLAMTSDGTVWGWGFNGSDGILGDGTSINRAEPVKTKQMCATLPTSINDMETSASFALYPNPVTNVLFVENNNGDYTRLSISNILGQVLLQKDITKGINEIDVATIPQGIFYIQVNGNKKNAVRRFIRN